MGGVQSSLRMLWEGRRVLVTSAEKLCTPPTPLNNDGSLRVLPNKRGRPLLVMLY